MNLIAKKGSLSNQPDFLDGKLNLLVFIVAETSR